jgi:hypothetical protein
MNTEIELKFIVRDEKNTYWIFIFSRIIIKAEAAHNDICLTSIRRKRWQLHSENNNLDLIARY